MDSRFLEIKAALEACFTVQMAACAAWHEKEAEMPPDTGENTVENLRNLVLIEHYCNFQLWHVEDRARRADVPDTVIAECKREVDIINQQRNDGMESVDRCLWALMEGHLPPRAERRLNTETLGMAVDRISILALKIYHMEEQTRRTDAGPGHAETCKAKLGVLQRQRADLIEAVLELINDYAVGRKVPVLYQQFKMYNDPALNPELYTKKHH